MSYRYQKQSWKTYDKTLPDRVQEDSLITKQRLDHMESGIEQNSMPLTIGDLVIGKDTTPSASFVTDEDAQEIKLNIVFPKSSDINDKTIKDDATWSSRKIRTEIDKIANNTYYTCEIESNTGLLFTNTEDVKTLSAKIFQSGRDITVECVNSAFVWSRKSKNTDYDDFWNGKFYTGKTLTVSSSDLVDCSNVTFYCSYESVNEDGAMIETTGSITLANMIFESENTSISFNLDVPNGTIFDNKSSDILIVDAQVYEGSKQITEENADFRWYLNDVIIPEKTTKRLEYPVAGLPLVSVITCEVTYNLAVYKGSVTIENRKNVTVSATAPNDPEIGDIWYDSTMDLYKKWTEQGWVVIEDPKSEITGDIILAVESIKTVQETANKLEEVRKDTYTVTKDGQVIYIKELYNQFITSAEETTRTITAVIDDMGELKEKTSKISQKADRIDLIVQDADGDGSSITLTDEFYRLVADKVEISASNIDLTGYTTVNGYFWIDEEGKFGATCGTIGPWTIDDTSIFLDDTENSTRVYMGLEGLKFSNKLTLTPSGGIKTPNFKVDPKTDSVIIDASEIRLGGVDIVTKEDNVGLRNFILTSGNFRADKVLAWETDELPWNIVIEPENADSSSTINQDETYITLEKLADSSNDKKYIKLPLSTELSYGKYIFNIRMFTKKSSGSQNINIYLLTEDGDVENIGNFTATNVVSINYTTYNQTNNTRYKYVAFDTDDFAIGDTFSIINLSLYRSDVIVTDWYPAPEDSGYIYDEITGDVQSTVANIRNEINTAKGEIIQTISNEYVTKRDQELFKETVSKTIKDSSDALEITFTNKIDKINETTGLEERVSTIEKYITFVDGNIELSTSENSIKLTLEHDRVGFTDSSGSDLAYFDTHMMHITDLEVDKSLKIGNFLFYPRKSGRLTVKKL